MRIEEGTEFLDRLKDTVHEQHFEIERLKKIINELEFWLQYNLPKEEKQDLQLVLDKLKELKEK